MLVHKNGAAILQSRRLYNSDTLAVPQRGTVRHERTDNARHREPGRRYRRPTPGKSLEEWADGGAHHHRADDLEQDRQHGSPVGCGSRRRMAHLADVQPTLGVPGVCPERQPSSRSIHSAVCRRSQPVGCGRLLHRLGTPVRGGDYRGSLGLRRLPNGQEDQAERRNSEGRQGTGRRGYLGWGHNAVRNRRFARARFGVTTLWWPGNHARDLHGLGSLATTAATLACCQPTPSLHYLPSPFVTFP